MITAGIDMGAKTTKAVILRDGNVIARALTFTGFDQKEAAEKALADALAQAALNRSDVARTFATGVGRQQASFANGSMTEMAADTKGSLLLNNKLRTVIDVGAEEGRAMKCTAEGKVTDFAVNEKCAAGAGSFVEAMSRALELPLEKMGEMSLRSKNAVAMNAQCTVFAESEVVSLVHAKTPKEDIVRALHDAIANRIVSMARRVGVEESVGLVGGVGYNIGFVDALRRCLEVESVWVPEQPEYVGAIGAAVAAAEAA
ncbi:MAG: CoA activase [Acidobacteria bacterium]|nr:CoA activase [Acidobacteriota bacterium]